MRIQNTLYNHFPVILRIGNLLQNGNYPKPKFSIKPCHISDCPGSVIH